MEFHHTCTRIEQAREASQIIKCDTIYRARIYYPCATYRITNVLYITKLQDSVGTYFCFSMIHRTRIEVVCTVLQRHLTCVVSEPLLCGEFTSCHIKYYFGMQSGGFFEYSTAVAKHVTVHDEASAFCEDDITSLQLMSTSLNSQLYACNDDAIHRHACVSYRELCICAVETNLRIVAEELLTVEATHAHIER